MNIKEQVEEAIDHLQKLIQTMDRLPIVAEAQELIGYAKDAIASGNVHLMYSILAALWVITMRVRSVLLAAVYDSPESDEDLRAAVDNFDRLAVNLQADVRPQKRLGLKM